MSDTTPTEETEITPTPEVPEAPPEAPAQKRVHFGAAQRPSQVAKARRQAERDAQAEYAEHKPASAKKFHARRSLVTTGTSTRPDPITRARTDVRRVNQVDPELAVPAGPAFEGEHLEGQA